MLVRGLGSTGIIRKHVGKTVQQGRGQSKADALGGEQHVKVSKETCWREGRLSRGQGSPTDDCSIE